MLSRTAVDRNYLGESLNRRLPEFASSQPERTASPSAPLRCLVLQDDDQTVDIGSFDRAVDENEPFDVIVLVVRNGLQAGDRRIEQLMARSSNPAAPIIAYTKDDNPRIDVRLSDTSSASVSSALAMVQPIVNQLAQLPRIPQGADRLRSLMLQLAYTRNAPLEAKWAQNSRAMVSYPQLAGIPDPRAMLEELASAGLLRRRFFDRVFACAQCGSSQMIVREVCVKCHSSNIEEQPLLHHYVCGFQGAQRLFHQEGADGYQCPKCSKELRHYGMDYDKPGAVTECHACGDVMSEPDAYFICTDCNSNQPSEAATKLTWYHYDLTPEGIAAVQAGSLSRDESTGANRNRRHTLRDFRMMSRQAIALAAEHGRPISAIRMTIAAPDRQNVPGLTQFLESLLFANEIAIECLRGGDIAASLPDGIVAYLPEANRSGAERVIKHIERAIAGAIDAKLTLNFQIYSDKSIRDLLEVLR